MSTTVDGAAYCYDRRAQRAYLGEYLGRTASPGDTWACGLRRHLSPRRIVARATWRGHVEGAPGVATWLAVQSRHVAGGVELPRGWRCRVATWLAVQSCHVAGGVESPRGWRCRVATWLAVQSCHVAGGAAAIYLTKCRRAAPMGKLHIRPVGHDCERPRRDHAEIHPRCVIEIHPRYTSEIHPRYQPRYQPRYIRDGAPVSRTSPALRRMAQGPIGGAAHASDTRPYPQAASGGIL